MLTREEFAYKGFKNHHSGACLLPIEFIMKYMEWFNLFKTRQCESEN